MSANMKAAIHIYTDDFAYVWGFEDGTAIQPQAIGNLGVDAWAVYLEGYLDGLRITMPTLAPRGRYIAESYRASALALAVVLEELR